MRAQIPARFASVVARAPIPADVRTGDLKDEKIAAYCDALAKAVEPLVAKADEALNACVDRLLTPHADGWWNAYCSGN
jgi:hypothetical protein